MRISELFQAPSGPNVGSVFKNNNSQSNFDFSCLKKFIIKPLSLVISVVRYGKIHLIYNPSPRKNTNHSSTMFSGISNVFCNKASRSEVPLMPTNDESKVL